VIMAPADGYIVVVNARVSGVTSAQNYSSTTAIQLVDTSYVRFTGQVDEVDIMKVTPGENATITIDALPNKNFTGHVQFISPFGSAVGQVIKFTVYIELDPTQVTLKGGLSATAVVAAASVKNVLLIPVSVITNTNRGPVVLVVNDKTGVPERRSITLGLQNFQYAEVKSGLQEGDKVQAVPQQFMGTGGASTPGGGGAAFRGLR